MTVIGVPERAGPIGLAFQIKRWLVAALGMGFLGLAADVFMEHYFTMHSMRPGQWIPVAFGPLAGAIALATAWRFEAMTLRPFSIVSWMSVGVGTLGLYYHGRALARNLDTFASLLDAKTLFAILPHVPPLGAPMAFVAMGVLGLLVHTCAMKLTTLLRPTPARAVTGFLTPLLKPFRDAVGLTLYETTAVVAMTSIVAAVALPVVMDRIEQSKASAAASEAVTIANAMMSFFRDTGRWPGEVEIRRIGSTSCFLQTGAPATDPTQGPLLPQVGERETDATTRTSRLSSAARTLPQVGNLGIDASQFIGRTCNTLTAAAMLNINEFLVRKPSEIDYPNWAGPYMEPIASDPWDQAYLINVLPLIFATDIPDPGSGRVADTGQTTTVGTVTVSGSATGGRVADTGRTTTGVSLGFGWIITAGPDRALQTPLTRPQLDEGSDDVGKNIGARIVKSAGGRSASGLSPSTSTLGGTR